MCGSFVLVQLDGLVPFRFEFFLLLWFVYIFSPLPCGSHMLSFPLERS